VTDSFGRRRKPCSPEGAAGVDGPLASAADATGVARRMATMERRRAARIAH
jgi:hypothetical protein